MKEKKEKRFYAVHNEASKDNMATGYYCIDWTILQFESKKTRDHFIEKCPTPWNTLPIKKSRIGRFIDRPRAFSGNYWGINDDPAMLDFGWYAEGSPPPDGFLGVVDICEEDSMCERVFSLK